MLFDTQSNPKKSEYSRRRNTDLPRNVFRSWMITITLTNGFE